MLEQHLKSTPKKFKIIERSLYSARYCFAEVMVENNILHRGMYNILQKWYDFIDRNIQIRADLIVYLRTSPEIAFNRMKGRGREGESLLTLDYLSKLHNLHENQGIQIC